MNPSPDCLIEIFNEALKLAPESRDAYLEQACRGEGELKRRAEVLLDAHGRAGSFLSWAVEMLQIGSTTDSPVAEGPGDKVGNYKLIRQIGEGGCGIVFLAEQEEPVRREVALKVVKPGMDTRSVIARFESERQTLALMEHPHIAQVLDAGATDSGRPYFVMELVRGTHITSYCDRDHLAISARLELFVQVCHAIQHAHQKGIIHRDIKPSNILVSTTAEGAPLPKVIDFGIAKATTGQQLADKTIYTAFAMLVGTPAYMSPEQAAMKGGDVDTRTDIYSLGVLLYELLTGAQPIEIRELFEVGLDEVRRDILDKVPPRPSLRLKEIPPADLTTAARHRQVETPRLIRLVRGDLDWIVMKALEKDRSRRYPTANALAMDVQRHLANEPVTARPPSAAYQVGKLVSRNRLLVGSLAVIALLLVTSLAVMSVLLARERAAHVQAEIGKRTAREEAIKSTQVSDVLSKMLSSVSPSVAMGRDKTILLELLARTDREIGANLANQPEVEASLRVVLGNSYYEIGDLPSAERMHRRALEIYQAAKPPNRRHIASALGLLGYILTLKGEYAEAEVLFQSSRDIWRELDTGDERLSVRTLEFLAILYSRQKRNDEAEALMRRVLEWRQSHLGPDDPELVNALANLALVAHGSRKYPEAEKLYGEVLEKLQRQQGKSDPILVTTLQNLSNVASAQGRYDEAEKYLSRAVALYRKHFYPGHPARLEATLKLSELYLRAGTFAEAAVLYREVVENGMNHFNPTVTAAFRGLVRTLYGQEKTGEVESLCDEILTPDFSKSPQSCPVLETRAELLARSGRWREAAADAATLVRLEPEKHQHYHTLAPLLVASGDEEAYRKLCQEILVRFAGTTDIYTADRMAKDCLIRPGAVADPAAVGRMADLAISAGAKDISLPLFKACKALAEYRQGNFAAAADLAGTVGSSLPDAEVEALAVRTMALHRMNRPAEARTLLAHCTTTFETHLPAFGSGNLGENWRDWIVARELLGEARGLVGIESP